MTTGLKLGSGYARWRPPSRATVFTRRWWWVAALLVLAIAATFAAIAMVRSDRARVAAEARAKRYARQIYYAREYLRKNGIETSGPGATFYRELGAFMVSLTDKQIEDLAYGRDLPVGTLLPQQRQVVEAYCRAREAFALDAIGYVPPPGEGPAFGIYAIRTRDGKRIPGWLWPFRLEWRERNP